jgi:hypothetical protein
MRAALGCCALAAVIVLAACDQKPKVAPKPQQIFKQEREALDQAKGVQNTLDSQAAEARKKLEEAEK